MAYIGNIPAESYASFETETFSVSATANYTLSHAVTNENEIRLVINGVVQQPGSGKAYTASGTTLTLTSATVSGDSMYAVYLGRALQTVNPPNASVGSAQVADSLISGKTALGATPADTDELLISDAGTLKRVDYSYLKSANTPAFFAYRSGSNQSMPDASVTVIQMNSEVYDTDSAYDTSTYKFTPQTAGKYLLHTQYETNGGGDQVLYIAYILKNGSSTGGSQFLHRGSGGSSFSLSTTSVLDANGSSDYFQAGFYQGSSSVQLLTGIQNTYFTAYKIIT